MFLGQKLELGQEIGLRLKGAIKEEVLDNQDGSVNICYVFKAMAVEVQS